MANGSRRVLEEVGDLIDVLAHGFRCGAGVALPQCRDDSFMSQDGSAWTALLLQRELARFHEQIVQCGHDTDDHAIARGAREDVVKSRVLDDGRSAGFELFALRVEDALQVGKVLVGDARGRGARDGGFEHAAHVQQLVLQFITVAQDGSQRRDEPVDVELLRKCALTVARDEQADGLQRTERVADRPAADAELFGKCAFGGQSLTRRERAVENQHPDTIGDLFGHPRLSDRLYQTRVAGAGRPPGGDKALDTTARKSQTRPRNWFDHWYSVARRQSAGMGETLTFTATGSPQAVSRAIEEYARGHGHVTAIVAEPPDHPEKQTLVGVFDRFVRQAQSRFQGAST